MKNKNAVYLLFLANIISGLAQGISMIAIPWYFIEIIEKPKFFTYCYFIITFLTFFWGMYAGTIIDRYSRKKIFLITNFICGTIIASVSAYGFYNQSTSEYLVILVFLITIFNYNVHYPNLYAFGQEITEKKNYGKLNSYIEIQGQSTSMFAGAIAAILLTGSSNDMISFGGFNFNFPLNFKAWDIHEIFLMDAITYFISLLIIMLIKYVKIEKLNIETGSLYNRFISGLNFLKKRTYIFYFGLFSYMLFAFTLVQIHIILPIYVKNFLQMGADVYASSEFYYSIGAIFSGIFVIRVFKNNYKLLGVIIFFTTISIFFYLISFINSVYLFFITCLLLGITNAGVRVLRTTFLFNAIPNNIIGRATSVFSSINIIVRLFLIGIFSISFFQTGDNIKYSYLIGVVLLMSSAIPLALNYGKIIESEN